jgi:hypothetical protein
MRVDDGESGWQSPECDGEDCENCTDEDCICACHDADGQAAKDADAIEADIAISGLVQ